jgi:hypothetical protein
MEQRVKTVSHRKQPLLQSLGINTLLDASYHPQTVAIEANISALPSCSLAIYGMI